MEDERRITEMVVRFMPGSPALVFIIQGKEEIVNKTNLEMGTPAVVCLFRPPYGILPRNKNGKKSSIPMGRPRFGVDPRLLERPRKPRRAGRMLRTPPL
jgi:hypothetical protein